MKSKDHGNLPFSPLHISSSLPHPHFPTIPLSLSSLTLPTSFLPLSHPPSLSHHSSLLPHSMSCLHSLSSSPSYCPTRPNLQLSLQWAFFFSSQMSQKTLIIKYSNTQLSIFQHISKLDIGVLDQLSPIDDCHWFLAYLTPLL